MSAVKAKSKAVDRDSAAREGATPKFSKRDAIDQKSVRDFTAGTGKRVLLPTGRSLRTMRYKGHDGKDLRTRR